MLIDELKFNLGIVGTSQDADLNTIIDKGKARLTELAGATLDFDVEGLPKSLLSDFCRYAYNNATEYFETNFSGEILRMQLQSAVILNVTEQTTSNESSG
jgi:hypothetical protein